MIQAFCHSKVAPGKQGEAWNFFFNPLVLQSTAEPILGDFSVWPWWSLGTQPLPRSSVGPEIQ